MFVYSEGSRFATILVAGRTHLDIGGVILVAAAHGLQLDACFLSTKLVVFLRGGWCRVAAVAGLSDGDEVFSAFQGTAEHLRHKYSLFAIGGTLARRRICVRRAPAKWLVAAILGPPRAGLEGRLSGRLARNVRRPIGPISRERRTPVWKRGLSGIHCSGLDHVCLFCGCLGSGKSELRLSLLRRGIFPSPAFSRTKHEDPPIHAPLIARLIGCASMDLATLCWGTRRELGRIC